MRITKLPCAIDPNVLMREEIQKRNSVCPFCGETEKYNVFSDKGVTKGMRCKTWYGNKYEGDHPFIGFFAFWEPNYHWSIDLYSCHTCGAEWEGEPYPKIEI